VRCSCWVRVGVAQGMARFRSAALTSSLRFSHRLASSGPSTVRAPHRNVATDSRMSRASQHPLWLRPLPFSLPLLVCRGLALRIPHP